MAYFEHSNNAYSHKSMQVGGATPFIIDPELLRMRLIGGIVKNTLAEGEKIAAGTTFAYNAISHEVKFLKVWKVKSVTSDASSGDSTIVIQKTFQTPVLKADTVIMVAPSTLAGTGKAVAAGTVTEGTDTYTITVDTASIDSVEAGTLLVEAAEAGASKGMYCQPNNILHRDFIAGNQQNLGDAVWGFFHAYINTINPIPAAVLANLNDGIVPVWEYFAEKD